MTDPPGEVQRVHCDGLLEVMEVAVVAPVVVEEEEVEVEEEEEVGDICVPAPWSGGVVRYCHCDHTLLSVTPTARDPN